MPVVVRSVGPDVAALRAGGLDDRRRVPSLLMSAIGTNRMVLQL